MNWTPGPWVACLDESDGGNESTEIRVQDSLIANVYGARDFPCITDEDTDITPAEFAANAVLIAEAPVMYEALRDLVEVARKYANSEAYAEFGDHLMESVHKAEIILSQARGEVVK